MYLVGVKIIHAVSLHFQNDIDEMLRKKLWPFFISISDSSFEGNKHYSGLTLLYHRIANQAGDFHRKRRPLLINTTNAILGPKVVHYNKADQEGLHIVSLNY